jgi:hypothetical protein
MFPAGRCTGTIPLARLDGDRQRIFLRRYRAGVYRSAIRTTRVITLVKVNGYIAGFGVGDAESPRAK